MSEGHRGAARRARRVLVVDDEALVRMNAVDTFEDMGFEVLEAGGGQEALQVLEEHSDVALLFTDCRMPGMSGPELAEVVAQRWPDIRIVLVTGYVNMMPMRDWPLMWKPYGAAELERVVGRELGTVT